MAAKLRAPGWYRAGTFFALGIGFAYGLTCLLRALYGYDPRPRRRRGPDGRADRGAAVLPRRPRRLRLLVLLGVGQARRGPRTTPRTAPTRWKDYFRVNTDHKVIGIQYVGHLVLLPARRRPDGDAHARRARAAGHAVRRRQRRSTGCSRSTRRC